MAERIGKNHLHGKALSLWGCLMVRDDIGVPVDDVAAFASNWELNASLKHSSMK